MIEWIARWPLGTGETLALVGALAGFVLFVWRTALRVERGIGRLEDGLQGYAKNSDEATRELGRRVSALEDRVRAQTAQEGSVLATLGALQTQVGAMSSRLDGLVSALLRRPE
ncbi:hypothetical protein [uncultured Amaricoccus sp.]|uniref:hypothetical protein n=1 Tax=uncultured Amaricoccus sp. TaxID=339341 RepID=UPI002617689F|nr:hypothetical protein [uncultured Amaricoccus sp.]